MLSSSETKINLIREETKEGVQMIGQSEPLRD